MSYAPKLAITWAVAKGLGVTVAVTLLDIEFWKALIVAVVSALIGLIGALIAAYIAVREGARVSEKLDNMAAESNARRTGDKQRSAKLDDIAAKLDAARRRTDLRDAKESDEHSPQS